MEGAGLGPEAARALYCDIASAAESGWGEWRREQQGHKEEALGCT